MFSQCSFSFRSVFVTFSFGVSVDFRQVFVPFLVGLRFRCLDFRQVFCRFWVGFRLVCVRCSVRCLFGFSVVWICSMIVGHVV